MGRGEGGTDGKVRLKLKVVVPGPGLLVQVTSILYKLVTAKGMVGGERC